MVPQSAIYICPGVLLRSDQAHTIYFSNYNAQLQYFLRQAAQPGGAIYSDYTITRNNVAYVEASLVSAEYWNYCMITDVVQNGNTFTKFYFIENVEYVDENTVALYLKLDVMQTFQHQPNGGYVALLPSCWVEREHSVYDGSRAFNGTDYNTVDEPIDTGEYVTRNETNAIAPSIGCIVAAATIDLSRLTTSSTDADVVKVYGFPINGVYSGIGYYAAPYNLSGSVAQLINHINTLGYIDGIIDIFIFPDDLIALDAQDTQTATSPFAKIVSGVVNDLSPYARLTIPRTSIGGYTPRNKKLLQYPYTFGYVTNNQGLSAVYRFEYLEPDPNYPTLFAMKVTATPTSDAAISLIPAGTYKGESNPLEYGISITNFPHIPWVTDTYSLWLAQTANTRRFNIEQAKFEHTYRNEVINAEILGAMANGVMSGIEALASGGGVGMNGLSGSFMTLGKAGIEQWANDRTYDLALEGMQAGIKDHYITPPQAQGASQGMLSLRNLSCYPRMMIKSVDDMHLRIIDQFFDHYGYAVNTFKVPNISSRPAWNFVKTAGFDAKLNIAQRYKIAISDIFNNGVTFWKDPARIGDYSQNNSAS